MLVFANVFLYIPNLVAKLCCMFDACAAVPRRDIQGEMLALIAPSGGGKTTLLNLLSGRLKINSGTITYNGQPYSKSFKQRIGFVLQDDLALPHLTVKETLTYAALLRLPNTLTREQKKERALNVISELGLESCQNTVIGGTYTRGISGGERKRVCIGNEILLNPSLLLLDEPTSGLDSTTALRIVQMLHNIAKPSSRLFSKYDKLILLGKGSSLYFGKASEALSYFSSIGYSPLIAMNPAEFLIDLANGNMEDKSIPSQLEETPSPAGEKMVVNGRKPSPLVYLLVDNEARTAKMRKVKCLKGSALHQGKPEVEGRLHSTEVGATWWEQFSILLRRGFKERRHEYFSGVRVTQVISTAVIVGLLWWHSNSSSDPQEYRDQASSSAIFTFLQERAMLAKEQWADMYKLSAYFAARNISDLPLDLLLLTVFMLIVYFMVGLKLSFAAFSLTLLTVSLSIVAAQGLGLSIGAAFMDVKKASTLTSVTIMTFMLSGGYFIQNVPRFMSWLRYVPKL
ncbi:ABC transporter G member 22 [Ancistrocladus abbreviatus]